jgi:hypothetical protein
MKYVLLIYQGTTPLPSSPDEWAKLSQEEQTSVWADYSAIGKTPGVESGLPLGLPGKAVTVQVKDKQTVATEGPFAGNMGAVGGYLIFEADSMDEAVALAGRVPAARLGGAVEVRPAEPYW